MILQNMSSARRISTNILIGALTIILLSISDAGLMINRYIDSIKYLLPNYQLLLEAIGNSKSLGVYTTIFLTVSWSIGEILTRASEFTGYKSIRHLKSKLERLEDKNKKMGWLRRNIFSPLFVLPDRTGIRDRLKQSVELSGYEIGNPQQWYDENNSELLRCFEIAEFIVCKSTWMREYLKVWDEATHVCAALGLVFMVSAVMNLANMPVFIIAGNYSRAVYALFLCIGTIYIGAKAWRLSSFLELRQIDQLFTWFILTATGPKRGGGSRSTMNVKKI